MTRSAKEREAALFAPAGAPDSEWPAGSDAAIPDELIADARARLGYRVIPTP